MKILSLNTAVLAFLVLGLVVPTGAVLTGSEDTVWADRGVVLTPHDGPNGEYAEIGPDGNVSVDLETVGVNPNALTSVERVFDINNHEQTPVRVWITHDAIDRVTFAVEGAGSIQGRQNNLTIRPGEAKSVSLRIDTTGKQASGEPLLTSFRIHVASDAPSTGTPANKPTDTPTPNETTPTDTPSEPPVDDGEVEVELDDEETPGGEPDDITIRDLSTDELDNRERNMTVRSRPKAVADVEVNVSSRARTDEESRGLDDLLQNENVTAITEVGEGVTLDGTLSIVGRTDAVDPERKIVRAVDIEVPEDKKNTPGTVRISVAKEKFGDSDPARARIGHLTDEGWRLLKTSVARETESSVVLEARTRGFSPFAVFAKINIAYEWELDNESLHGQEIRTRFDEPGIHNATLTVTDSFNQSDSATVRLLVNDVPEVRIEAPENRTAGEPVTLTANVTNDVGNATVTWILPDGSQTVGESVERSFESGEQTVRVIVEDEYGATGQDEATLDFAPAGTSEPIITRIVDSVPGALGLGTIVVLALLLALLFRRFPSAGLPPGKRPIRAIRALFRRRSPRIVTVDEPTVDVENHRFVIGHIRIEDPDGDLETVGISVTDQGGTEVARKTIDLRGRTEYRSRNHVVVPKSRVYVRTDREYRVTVLARDGADRKARRRSSSFRAPGTARV